jgi:transcriptional regulator with XRE-family HTH domain
MDAKKLGKKIKLARVELDMTQADLAKATEIMQKSISRYETGLSLPSLETLEKMAKALKKSFGYFLDEEG